MKIHGKLHSFRHRFFSYCLVLGLYGHSHCRCSNPLPLPTIVWLTIPPLHWPSHSQPRAWNTLLQDCNATNGTYHSQAYPLIRRPWLTKFLLKILCQKAWYQCWSKEKIWWGWESLAKSFFLFQRSVDLGVCGLLIRMEVVLGMDGVKIMWMLVLWSHRGFGWDT